MRSRNARINKHSGFIRTLPLYAQGNYHFALIVGYGCSAPRLGHKIVRGEACISLHLPPFFEKNALARHRFMRTAGVN